MTGSRARSWTTSAHRANRARTEAILVGLLALLLLLVVAGLAAAGARSIAVPLAQLNAAAVAVAAATGRELEPAGPLPALAGEPRPEVSLIVPVYNEESTLENVYRQAVAALESCLGARTR